MIRKILRKVFKKDYDKQFKEDTRSIITKCGNAEMLRMMEKSGII